MELKFDTGLVTYSLNGACEVHFNPTDGNFVRKLYGVFDELDKEQESYRSAIKELTEPTEIFDFINNKDKEMRKILDGLFDIPICEAVFGNLNVYAMANGFPIWANLLLSVMDTIDSSFVKEQKLTSTRISKYTAKYTKK